MSQLMLTYPEPESSPETSVLFYAKIMGGAPMVDTILVNIVGNEARVMQGWDIVRMVLLLFDDKVEVTYGLPAQAWTDSRCKYSKLDRYVQKRCKAFKIDISVFDNLSYTHEEKYATLIRN